MNWKRLLACITGSVDQELLLRNDYLVTENRILRNQLQGRVRLTDNERITLAEIGKRLGRKRHNFIDHTGYKKGARHMKSLTSITRILATSMVVSGMVNCGWGAGGYEIAERTDGAMDVSERKIFAEGAAGPPDGREGSSPFGK